MDDFFSFLKQVYQNLGAWVNDQRQTVHEKTSHERFSSDGSLQKDESVDLHTLGCLHYAIPHGVCFLCKHTCCKDCLKYCAYCGVTCCTVCSLEFPEEKMTLCTPCADYEIVNRHVVEIEADIRNWRLF